MMTYMLTNVYAGQRGYACWNGGDYVIVSTEFFLWLSPYGKGLMVVIYNES